VQKSESKPRPKRFKGRITAIDRVPAAPSPRSAGSQTSSRQPIAFPLAQSVWNASTCSRFIGVYRRFLNRGPA
jgi:hypothetical protein